MIYLIEGARNSGKTYLLNKAEVNEYKFPFPYWYGKLKLSNSDKATHDFAIGKEIMLHHLNQMGHIDSDIYIDRGIITALVWGVLENRITADEAVKQLWLFAKAGLFDDAQVIYVHGTNPNERGAKDLWDNSNRQKEIALYELLLDSLHEAKPGSVTKYENDFTILSAVGFSKLLKG